MAKILRRALALSALILLAAFPSGSARAQTFNLTGAWRDDNGIVSAVRQVGEKVCWYADARPRVHNVFCGIIAGSSLTGNWLDLPGGEIIARPLAGFELSTEGLDDPRQIGLWSVPIWAQFTGEATYKAARLRIPVTRTKPASRTAETVSRDRCVEPALQEHPGTWEATMRVITTALRVGPLLLAAAYASNPEPAAPARELTSAIASHPGPQPLAAAPAPAAAWVAPVQAPDLSGTWDFGVVPWEQTLEGTLTLRRSGTGYSGALLNWLLRELRMSGDTVTMVFDLEGQERATLTVVLSSDRRAMSGSLRFPDNSFLFNARKRYRIRFARGEASATVEDAVVRGTRDRYLLGARAGQTMRVTITALEDNAVFLIEGPDGRQLPGAEEMRDATSWHGDLPLTGDYVIVVGGTRGNATYRLTVSIAPR